MKDFDALDAFVEMSRSVGEDPSLVQGGGGNVSCKTADGKYMYIKASGCSLARVDRRNGWRRLEMESLRRILEDDTLPTLPPEERESRISRLLLRACDDEMPDEARPSVESNLHALLGRCVVHVHPVGVCSIVCAKEGLKIAETLFRDVTPPVLVLPYVDPGYTLAMRMKRELSRYWRKHGRLPEVVLLGNHGLFVSADTPRRALDLVREIDRRCTLPDITTVCRATECDPSVVEEIKLSLRRLLFEAVGKRFFLLHLADRNDRALTSYLSRHAAAFTERALTPDEIVYVGGAPLVCGKADPGLMRRRLQSRMRRGGVPLSFFVRDCGIFLASRSADGEPAASVLRAHLHVRAGTLGAGGPRPLGPKAQAFIERWEAESFRRKQAERGGGVLEGRIAVVTGAGSGLGRHISVGLAGAGCAVGLLDVDAASAEESAEIIRRRHGNDVPLMVLRCDVTDEAAVEDAYRRLLDRWGGLDILVNAAGIAPAFELTELPVDAWRKALEINLTGYFLMAKHAARIMIRQGIGGCIINISSKSGLEASKNNTPYNATKAGEIHMARGWALELGKYGIRVNSVAPGNVFEGSKIWNPEYIKVCARKYGIKPEEVIPYYISKTALGVEIKGQDVAETVIFLCSDAARVITGQVLVPDAGQVMVR